MKALSAVVSLILISACATTPPATPPSPVPVPPESDGLHWFRDAAEQRAIYVEAIGRRPVRLVRSPRGWHQGAGA